jgi:hypothetical protein
MANMMSASERSGVLAVFENSFDTWSRQVAIYKEPLKTLVVPQPTTTNNAFGFGEAQQEPIYAYQTPRTGIFPAIIRDSDIESSTAQSAGVPLTPEIIARILASPVSMKVRRDCANFIDEGPTEKIVDLKNGETYLLNGQACMQTYQGSEYYVYPLRKTQ